MDANQMAFMGLEDVPACQRGGSVRIASGDFPRTILHGPQRSVLLYRLQGDWLHWVLLTWVSSDTDGGNPEYDILVYGEGLAGLREPQHMWFGDDGYVFYLAAPVLTWGLEQLKEWFDF